MRYTPRLPRLTPAEKRVHDWIAAYTRASRGQAPSFAEIALALSYAEATVAPIVHRCRAKGWLLGMRSIEPAKPTIDVHVGELAVWCQHQVLTADEADEWAGQLVQAAFDCRQRQEAIMELERREIARRLPP